jgi:hypothetical protein
MLNKTKSILAISSLVIGLSVSGPTFAGGNSIANGPSTPPSAAVVASMAAQDAEMAAMYAEMEAWIAGLKRRYGRFDLADSQGVMR